MSTISKERLEQLASGNAWVCVQDDEAAELARIALASLEVEPVAWLYSASFERGHVEGEITDAPGCDMPVYTAPPEPVSVPDEATPENIEILASTYAPRGVTFQWDRDECNAAADSWNACRAAMLQGADGTLTNEGTITATQFKPVADLYGLTSPTGGETSFTFDAVEARDFIDGGWSCQDYVELERFQEAVSGKSPVIPDGWVMVPVEPTEDMIVNGFESEPDESFSDEKEWEAYDAMSGCQQAAHRAKLCWAAMIAAAPKLK